MIIPLISRALCASKKYCKKAVIAILYFIKLVSVFGKITLSEPFFWCDEFHTFAVI